MERSVAKVVHVANKLTDANPTFVSLVEHGANQTPFKVVKSHIIPMDPKSQKYTFKSANFADEAACQTYLASKGFAEAVVTKTDTGFESVLKDADLFSEIKEVQQDGGVSQFVGVLKEVEQKSAERTRIPAEPTQEQTQKTEEQKPTTAETPAAAPAVQPVAKSLLVTKEGQELSKKFDSWVAYYGGQTTLAQAIEDASEGQLPIGYYELKSLFDDVIANNIRENNLTNIKSVCAEFADNVVKLCALFSAIEVAKGKDSEVAQKVAKSLFAMERNPSESDKPETTKKEAEVPPAETTPAPEPAPTPEPAAAPAAPVQTDVEKAISEAVAKAVEGVTKKYDELMKPLTEDLANVKKSLADLETPTRKSADHTEAPKPGEAPAPTTQPDTSKKVSKGWDNGSGV